MAGIGAAVNTGAFNRDDTVVVIGCGGVGDAAIAGARLVGVGTQGRSRMRQGQRKESMMTKVVCVLYDDPVDGYPKIYPRAGLPELDGYPGGQTLPTPSAVDFARELLGSVSGELGLRPYLEGLGTNWSSPPTRTGPIRSSTGICDAEVVISQPFWPAYLTAERIARRRTEAGADRRDRFRPRRPGCRDRGRDHCR